jgi:hypothetical protein
MAKTIYPGNYVNRLSSYQGQPVVAVPGRVYYHVTGYALVPDDNVGATSFDVIIPSPDRRADDKPRASITGLVVPAGAAVYHLGLRVPDMRKDRGVGTAFTGIVGTSTNRIKLADAIGNDDTITTTALSTKSSDVAIGANTTVAPVGTVETIVTPPILAGNETLKVFVTNSSGTSAGSAIYSTQKGGTPLIVEVAYYLPDAVADLGDVVIPFITETTG